MLDFETVVRGGTVVTADGDRYGGTWDHGEVGGFMFGRVVRE